jgi:hypothetical protein
MKWKGGMTENKISALLNKSTEFPQYKQKRKWEKKLT